MSFGSCWIRNPLTILTGVLAFVYGVGVAFGGKLGFSAALLDAWLLWGAGVVGLLFVASLLVVALRRPAAA